MHTRSTHAASLLLLSVLPGCENERSLTPAQTEPTPAAAATATTAPATETASTGASPRKPKNDRIHRAARCGECHEKMFQEWRTSPHARTNDGALYRALRDGSSDASCDRCHEPLRSLGAAEDFARADDVSCEVCHRMEKVTVHADVADAPLQPAHGTKFGPRCDPGRSSFHRAECRPIFGKSELCASCHHYSVERPDGSSLPVHTEYSDWKKGPYAARGKTCQSCHMAPGVVAELATDEPTRENVPDHGFWGREDALRATAIAARAEASVRGDTVTVKVEIQNERAGHSIPAGSPSRQLVLRVTLRDATGAELARDERVFQRALVDEAGAPAPFFRAVRVGTDTRIAPLETRRERFVLAAPAAATAHVALIRRTDPELATRVGAAPGAERAVTNIALPLTSGDARRAPAGRVALLQ